LRELDTILGSRLNTSIKVNELFIPANSVAQHLRTFAEPAIFHSDVEEPYDMSKSGSLTKLKINGRFFVLTTLHQLKSGHHLNFGSYNYDQLCIHNHETKHWLTSNRIIFPEGSEDNLEDFDCLLFEFTKAVEEYALQSSSWYNIDIDIKRDFTPKPMLVCCIGYPGFRNCIDYDNSTYAAAPNAIWGKEVKPSIRGRLAFKPINVESFDPAGMSGGPVFGIATEHDQLVTNFSGILTNASNFQFNFISFQRIKKLFDVAFGHQ
jgi:hypothetical protein